MVHQENKGRKRRADQKGQLLASVLLAMWDLLRIRLASDPHNFLILSLLTARGLLRMWPLCSSLSRPIPRSARRSSGEGRRPSWVVAEGRAFYDFRVPAGFPETQLGAARLCLSSILQSWIFSCGRGFPRSPPPAPSSVVSPAPFPPQTNRLAGVLSSCQSDFPSSV